MSDLSILKVLKSATFAAAADNGALELSPPFPVATPPAGPGFYFALYAGRGGPYHAVRYFDGQHWRMSPASLYPSEFSNAPGDQWRTGFTPWYPADVAPATPGLYPRRYPDPSIQSPDYWDGEEWFILDDQTGAMEPSSPVFEWRGLEPIATVAALEIGE